MDTTIRKNIDNYSTRKNKIKRAQRDKTEARESTGKRKNPVSRSGKAHAGKEKGALIKKLCKNRN